MTIRLHRGTKEILPSRGGRIGEREPRVWSTLTIFPLHAVLTASSARMTASITSTTGWPWLLVCECAGSSLHSNDGRFRCSVLRFQACFLQIPCPAATEPRARARLDPHCGAAAACSGLLAKPSFNESRFPHAVSAFTFWLQNLHRGRWGRRNPYLPLILTEQNRVF